VKESEALARSNERLSYATIDLSHEGVPQPWPNPDLVVVNPPRRGLDARVVETLIQRQPEHLVYVSCNPETLARDLNLLVGWSVEQVVAFDMMPQTPHVEVAVRLRREGSNVGQ
jgi:23S rRNA (uracil1939-C5)-methyltransferase